MDSVLIMLPLLRFEYPEPVTPVIEPEGHSFRSESSGFEPDKKGRSWTSLKPFNLNTRYKSCTKMNVDQNVTDSATDGYSSTSDLNITANGNNSGQFDLSLSFLNDYLMDGLGETPDLRIVSVGTVDEVLNHENNIVEGSDNTKTTTTIANAAVGENQAESPATGTSGSKDGEATYIITYDEDSGLDCPQETIQHDPNAFRSTEYDGTRNRTMTSTPANHDHQRDRVACPSRDSRSGQSQAMTDLTLTVLPFNRSSSQAAWSTCGGQGSFSSPQKNSNRTTNYGRILNAQSSNYGRFSPGTMSASGNGNDLARPTGFCNQSAYNNMYGSSGGQCPSPRQPAVRERVVNGNDQITTHVATKIGPQPQPWQQQFQWTPTLDARQKTYNYYQMHGNFAPASDRCVRYNQTTGSFGMSGVNHNWYPTFNNGRAPPPINQPGSTVTSFSQCDPRQISSPDVTRPPVGRKTFVPVMNGNLFHPKPPKNSHKCHCIECGSITEILDHSRAIVIRSPYYGTTDHSARTLPTPACYPSNRTGSTSGSGQSMFANVRSDSAPSCQVQSAAQREANQIVGIAHRPGSSSVSDKGLGMEISEEFDNPSTPLDQIALDNSKAQIEEWLEHVEAGRPPSVEDVTIVDVRSPAPLTIAESVASDNCSVGGGPTFDRAPGGGARGGKVNGRRGRRGRGSAAACPYSTVRLSPNGKSADGANFHPGVTNSNAPCPVTIVRMDQSYSHQASVNRPKVTGTGTQREHNFKQFEMELFQVGSFKLTNTGTDVEKRTFAMKVKIVFIRKRILFEFPKTFEEKQDQEERKEINPCFALMIPMDSVTGLMRPDTNPSHIYISVSNAPLVFSSQNRATDAEIQFDCTSINDPTKGQIYHNKLYHFSLSKGLQAERFVTKLTEFDERIRNLLVNNTIDLNNMESYRSEQRLEQCETA